MENKILLFLPNDSLGGAEQHLKNIASFYLEKGAIVEVYFLKRERTKAWRDLKGNFKLIFNEANTEKAGVLYLLKNLIFKGAQSCDCIYTSHVHLNAFVGILLSLKLLKTDKFIGRESTSIFKRFSGLKLFLFKMLYKVGYNNLDLLVCQTNFMKAQLIYALPKLSRKINIQVIPNPINLENIVLDELDLDLRDKDFIVSAGRLINEKGFDILIKAFSILKKENSNLKLVILGEGNLRKDLEGLCVELGLSADVLLLGFRKNVYTYFKYAKACVVSSRIEGFPNVLLQMMSQNETVISTLCAGGIDEIPGVFKCEIDNYESLSDTIQCALLNSDIDRKEMFHKFLEERSVSNFVNKMNSYLYV